ncbi:MAG: hypothetical protein IH804_02385, partial [Planctomycetes bacterium]|nr:hypothetical protein [Planctomycetota bacterium]
MDIEGVARETPEKLLTLTIDPASGYSGYQGRKIAFALGLEGALVRQCVDLVGKLYRAFIEEDMSLLEEILLDETGRKVGIHVPKRGAKRRLSELAGDNARHALEDRLTVTEQVQDRAEEVGGKHAL